MASITAAAAQATLSDCLAARQARPALPLSVGERLLRPLAIETTSGWMIEAVVAAAGIGVYVGLEGGILGAVCLVGGVLAGASALVSSPRIYRGAAHQVRLARAAKRMSKAVKQSKPGAGDVRRVRTLRNSIVEGDPFAASIAAVTLFSELAGQEALIEEVACEREPAWSTYLYFEARNKATADPGRARMLFEFAYMTGHPVWATAAAVAILDRLDEVADRDRVQELVEWVCEHGDAREATELVFYQ